MSIRPLPPFNSRPAAVPRPARLVAEPKRAGIAKPQAPAKASLKLASAAKRMPKAAPLLVNGTKPAKLKVAAARAPSLKVL